MEALITPSIGQNKDLQDAIRAAATEPQSPLSDVARGTAHGFLGSMLRWEDLSTTERILLRFCWENYHRYPCPFPLRP